MSGIRAVFARCKEENRAAFIPYLTGGDPDLETSADLLAALVDAGADIIEVGVPFSDPIADGPVNQRSATRALESGTTLSGILDMVAKHRRSSDVPIVLFSYFNPIFVRGAEEFAAQAADSGVDGVLCVDLPPNEAAKQFTPALRKQAIDSIFCWLPPVRATGSNRLPRRRPDLSTMCLEPGSLGYKAGWPPSSSVM